MLAGVQRLDDNRSVQVQRQSDDDGFDVFVFENLLVIVVDLDLLGLVAVMVVETLANAVLLRLPFALGLEFAVFVFLRFQVAGEDAFLVGRPNVGHGDDLQVLRIVLADQHAALVAGADQSGSHRLVIDCLRVLGVLEVRRGADRATTPPVNARLFMKSRRVNCSATRWKLSWPSFFPRVSYSTP